MLHLLWEFEWEFEREIAREDVFSLREREREWEENDGNGNGNGNGRKMMGAGTGGSLTKSGRETTGAKNMAARDGYVSVGIDSTTDSRPFPVPSRPPREFPSRFYPCKALEILIYGFHGGI